jgi:hypothetical protein
MTADTLKTMKTAEAIKAVEAFTGQIVAKKTKKAAIETLNRSILRNARFENKLK